MVLRIYSGFAATRTELVDWIQCMPVQINIDKKYLYYYIIIIMKRNDSNEHTLYRLRLLYNYNVYYMHAIIIIVFTCIDCSVIHVVGKVSIIDLLHHSVCIVFLVSNSPLVPASQEAVQDESKQCNCYHG